MGGGFAVLVALARNRCIPAPSSDPITAGSDLGLVPHVLHRYRQRLTQPSRGPHPRRQLRHRLGERLLWTLRGAAAWTPPETIPPAQPKPSRISARTCVAEPLHVRCVATRVEELGRISMAVQFH